MHPSLFRGDGFARQIIANGLWRIDTERAPRIDRSRTVHQIAEKPYLQYFPGLSSYQDEAPFDDSMLTYFRKRFDQKSLEKIKASIALKAKAMDALESKPEESPKSDQDDPPPQGKSIVDATCTPDDIKYPTDLKLLNEAREKTEAIIDRMHSVRTKPAKK